MFVSKIANQRRQAGDTIIEVLIAIAVVASVLAGAYYSANQNSRTVQDTQEHAQALQLVQGQVELLRSYLHTPGNTAFPAAMHCFDTTTGAPTTSCTAYPTTANYTLSVALDPTTNAYTVKATWDALTAHSASDVTIYYRP